MRPGFSKRARKFFGKRFPPGTHRRKIVRVVGIAAAMVGSAGAIAGFLKLTGLEKRFPPPRPPPAAVRSAEPPKSAVRPLKLPRRIDQTKVKPTSQPTTQPAMRLTTQPTTRPVQRIATTRTSVKSIIKPEERLTTRPTTQPIIKLGKVDRKTSMRLVKGKPVISAKVINDSLREGGAPLGVTGELFVKYGKKYGVAPEFGVAVFWMESNYGTKGIAVENKAISNMRYTKPKKGSRITYTNNKGFRKYSSWEMGIEDFFRLISQGPYFRDGLFSVEDIVSRYAPSKENKTESYVRVVVKKMNELRQKE